MNFGVRKEEAIYLRDLIFMDKIAYGEESIKRTYGEIDLEGMLRQLEIIITLADSVEEDKRIEEILRR